MSFTHLHVASGYSLQYGASSPDALVERAAGLGLESLALTDRDGLYGAIRFATACSAAGIAPLLGVDLAVEPTGLLAGVPTWADPAEDAARRAARGTPARGGGVVDPRHPRVTVLAHSAATASAPPDLLARPGVASPPAGPSDHGSAAVAPGWSALCRLVSATHLRGERGAPVTTPVLVARHARGEHLLPGPLRDGLPGEPSHPAPPLAASGSRIQPELVDVLPEPGALTVLLGASSELGRALLARRPDLARAVLAHWYDLLPLGALAVEVVCHEGPDDTPGSLAHAARMLGFARDVGVRAVLSAAVRYATPDGAATADVLDAARRLVPLGTRHLDRTTAAGYLAGTAEMAATAQRVAAAAGLGADGARDLLRGTEQVADRCRLDPGHDLGIGAVHLPEPDLVTRGGARTHTEADAVLRARCEAGIGRRYPGASERHLETVRRRLDDELATIASLGYPTYFLTVAEVCDLIRDRGVRVAARGSGAGSLVNHLVGISGVDPVGHGLLMERFCTPLRAELPDIDIDVESDRRTEIYEWVLERFGGERVSCVSMMDTYRVRHAVRDAGAALGLPPLEIDAIADRLPAHPRQGRPRRAARAARAAALRPGSRAVRPAVRPGRAARRPAPAHRAAPVRGAAQQRHAARPHAGRGQLAGLPDEPVRQGRRRGPRPAQARRARHPDAVRDGLRARRGRAGRRRRRRHRRRAPGRRRLPRSRHGADRPRRRPCSTTRRPSGWSARPAPSAASRSSRRVSASSSASSRPQAFSDLVIDISLFRPGPVKSDMISPFLRARQGWDESATCTRR